MYKLFKDPLLEQVTFVINTDLGCFIPLNPDNGDYQAYLKWLSEGNKPQEPSTEI
jgi:hypothetical protein